MEDDDDFSFCQVGSSGTQDGSVKANLSSDAGGITIRDEGSNGISGSSGISSFVWEGRLLKNTASRKEGTVGSLSFSVISTSSPKQSVESPRQVTSRNPGFSAKNLEEQQKLSVKKPAPCSKVPFEKGYSQMDWLKLTRTHPDLAGLKGQSTKRLISMDEVEQNQMEGSMWTVLKGRVYNLSPYMKFHPGGVDMLMKAVGRDCTSLFNVACNPIIPQAERFVNSVKPYKTFPSSVLNQTSQFKCLLDSMK